ncbi:hypothetical protein, partial [Methylobacterium thuringiense]|uniref:hypothetical protein n=1 Tax=Methylobacterium thuringiense TaxID=1003091 RepID=UPI001EE147FB
RPEWREVKTELFAAFDAIPLRDIAADVPLGINYLALDGDHSLKGCIERKLSSAMSHVPPP